MDMINSKFFLLSFLALALIAGAYFAGSKLGSESAEPVVSKPKNLEEIAKLENDFDQQQLSLTNRLAEVKNEIETVKVNLNLDELDAKLQSTEIADRLAELDEERLTTQTLGIASDVPIPADSPDGRVLNQPRTASGISQQALENYQQETGVSPQEIEDLLRRTE